MIGMTPTETLRGPAEAPGSESVSDEPQALSVIDAQSAVAVRTNDTGKRRCRELRHMISPRRPGQPWPGDSGKGTPPRRPAPEISRPFALGDKPAGQTYPPGVQKVQDGRSPTYRLG